MHKMKRYLPETEEEREYVIHGAANSCQRLRLPEKQETCCDKRQKFSQSLEIKIDVYQNKR